MTGKLPNGLTWRDLFEWLWRVIVVLLVPLLFYGWATISKINSEVNNLDRRVLAIESNRFTSNDGLEVWRQLGDRPTRAELEERLTRIEQKLDRALGTRQ